MRTLPALLLTLSITVVFNPASLVAFAEEAPSADQAISTPLQYFHLNDGSTIKGKLSAVQGDHYLVESTSMGNVSIRADNVMSIDSSPTSGLSGAAVANAMPATIYPPQGNQLDLSSMGAGQNGNPPLLSSPQMQQSVQQLQNKMMSDPSVMDEVKSMAQDPSFMAVMNDQELMKAIMNMDVEKIKANPKALELMNNPRMQQLMQKTGQMPKQ